MLDSIVGLKIIDKVSVFSLFHYMNMQMIQKLWSNDNKIIGTSIFRKTETHFVDICCFDN